MTSIVDFDREAKRIELARHGIESRPGKVFKVRVKSRAAGAHAGNQIKVGDHIYDVHERDLASLRAMVETATPHELELVKSARATACVEFDRARRANDPHCFYDTCTEVVFRKVIGREMRPFDLVEVLDEIGVIE